MRTLKPLAKYQCSKCDRIHDYDDDARECCAPEVWDIFGCPICGEYHDNENAALYCCQEDIGIEPMAEPRELELAGQKRLDI